MVSTYSTNLKFELIETGAQSGTWGTTTNSNLGTLIEQSIVGYTTQALSGAGPTAITIPDGATGVARNYTIEFTGTPTASHQVTVPAVQKSYILFNNTNVVIIVKVTGQTGVTIAVGKKAIVYNNGTDIIEVANAPVTEAGTQTLTNKTLTSPAITSPALTTPSLGAATATSINGNFFTSGTYTVTGAAGKTLTFSNSGTLAGGDAFTLAIAASKTLTVSNSLTLAGTDATTMTFPAITGTVGVLTNQSNWTKQQYFGTATLTDGATISWDSAAAQVAKVTLAGNRTMAAPTNLADGSFYSIYIIQDGTGSRTVTWNSVFKFTAAAAPTLTTTAAAKDFINFRSDGTNLYEIGRSLAVG